MSMQTEDQTQGLRQRVADYKRDNPRSHARDVASAVGVREVQLVALNCGSTATRLDTRFRELYEALPSLGETKTMARSEAVVIERWGAFDKVEIGDHMGQVVGEEIDLRLFVSRWRSAFAVTEQGPRGERLSIQVFDDAGDSVQKVYLEDAGKRAAYDALVAAHRAQDQSAHEEVAPPPPAPPEKADAEIDVAGFQKAWDKMQDTHDFYMIMRRFGVTRTQALRLGGRERAYPVSTKCLAHVLSQASQREMAIMLFVSNRGIIQIHTGLVKRVSPMEGWLNVLDPRLNLHVRESALAAGWVVKKPTKDGIVTSLELYDSRGDNVLLVFGKRKPGTPEDGGWRALVSELPTDGSEPPRSTTSAEAS
jgi:putative hemin transport protein